MRRAITSFLILVLLITAIPPSFSYAKNSEKATDKTEKKSTTKKESSKEKTEQSTKSTKESKKTETKKETTKEATKESKKEEATKESTKESKKEETTKESTKESKKEETTKESTQKATEETTSSDEETSTKEVTKATTSPTHTVITDESIKTPKVTASAAIIMEAKTGAILYEKDSNEKHYPASITKILTTLVALENADLDDKIKFKRKVLDAVEQDSSRIGVESKEVISLRNCLYAVMLASANDVSAGVADTIGGSVKNFAKMMNERAKELGCENSNFVNPHGLHNKNHYTTAYDMALITQAAIQNEDFCKISSTLTHIIPKTKKTVEKRYLYNHDKMLQDTEFHYDGIEYGKTGYTKKAGNTLVSVAKRGNLELICVVLKSNGYKNAYKDTKKLFDYGFDNYHLITPLEDFPLSEKLVHTKYFQSVSVEDMKKLNPSIDMNYQVVLPQSINVEDLSYKFYISPNDTTGLIGNLDILSDGVQLTRLPISYEPPLDKIKIERQPEIIHVTNDDSVPVRIIKRALAHKNLLTFLIVSCFIVIIMIVGVRSIVSSGQRKKRKLKK
ncbi:MAG: D-alanyl-D-alanine carboxypeptidase [Lachnospiraceae bacterium]